MLHPQSGDISTGRERELERSSYDLQRANTHVVVIDDNIFFLESWEISFPYKIKSFTSPHEFYKQLAEDSSLLTNALCVVTDFYFGRNSPVSGVQVAEKLRYDGYKGQIFLASDGRFDDRLSDDITAVISKIPEEAWTDIKKFTAI